MTDLIDQMFTFTRKTMLPWNLTQEWAWRARLFIYNQAHRIQRQDRVIEDWWEGTAPNGVMAEDIEELKRLLRAEEKTP